MLEFANEGTFYTVNPSILASREDPKIQILPLRGAIVPKA